MHPRRRPALRAILASALVGLAAAGATPAITAAASPAAGLTIDLTATIGTKCVDGVSSGGNGKITVQQKRSGNVIATKSDATGASFHVCLKPLKVGDTLVFKKGTTSTTQKVPKLLLSLDRSQSRANGQVPASNPDATVLVQDTVGAASMGGSSALGSIAEDGTFSLVTGSLFASDTATLFWVSPSGNQWDRIAAIPGLIVEVGKAKAFAIGSPGSSRTLTLKASGGAVRATGTVTMVNSLAAVTLKQSGSPVTVAVGDTVTVNGFPGVLTVLPDDLEVTAADGGTFTAHCAAFTRWYALTLTGGQVVHVWSGNADGAGLVGTTGAWTEGGPVPGDFTVRLDCESSDGLVQRMTDTVG